MGEKEAGWERKRDGEEGGRERGRVGEKDRESERDRQIWTSR